MTKEKDIHQLNQDWLREFDQLHREQTKGDDRRPVKLVAYKNMLLNVNEFIAQKFDEWKNPQDVPVGETFTASAPPAPLKTRASKRWTLDKLNEVYGFKAEEVWDEKGNYTPHPAFVKHKKAAGIIDAVYALQQSEQITISKAKELVTAIIEKHFLSLSPSRGGEGEEITLSLEQFRKRMHVAHIDEKYYYVTDLNSSFFRIKKDEEINSINKAVEDAFFWYLEGTREMEEEKLNSNPNDKTE